VACTELLASRHEELAFPLREFNVGKIGSKYNLDLPCPALGKLAVHLEDLCRVTEEVRSLRLKKVGGFTEKKFTASA
jgi:hypothetical protein